MKYKEYDREIFDENDILKHKNMFEKDIADKQKELSEFIKRANARIKWVKECEENKMYSVLGRIGKEGRDKYIILIIRYEDGTQRNERYKSNKIADMRVKLDELKEKYSGVDWSKFEEGV